MHRHPVWFGNLYTFLGPLEGTSHESFSECCGQSKHYRWTRSTFSILSMRPLCTTLIAAGHNRKSDKTLNVLTHETRRANAQISPMQVTVAQLSYPTRLAQNTRDSRSSESSRRHLKTSSALRCPNMQNTASSPHSTPRS